MSLFDISSDGFPWRAPRPHEIETRRAALSDLLIFDILLSSGGMRQPDILWPPTDPASLRRLLDAIEESTYDALKKDCLVYFLLKWHRDGREERFREDRCIPPQFAMLSDAYWHLDSGIQVERAVSLLCDVRLNRDYTSKIIQAISLSDTPARLVVQYLHTTKPMLTEPDDMERYILALAEDSLMNAWKYQRTFPEKSETRTRLLKKVIEWCFTRELPCLLFWIHGLIRRSKAASGTLETVRFPSALFFRAIPSPSLCSRAPSIITRIIRPHITGSRMRAAGPVGTIRGSHQARPAIREHSSRKSCSSIASGGSAPKNDRRRRRCASINRATRNRRAVADGGTAGPEAYAGQGRCPRFEHVLGKNIAPSHHVWGT
ncbi:nuclear pore complex assembly-domain-containing protein [Russula dissimulans]|nr:nuclear pore complex assembly-domain-containing protein [Russula dissimulans]